MYNDSGKFVLKPLDRYFLKRNRKFIFIGNGCEIPVLTIYVSCDE